MHACLGRQRQWRRGRCGAAGDGAIGFDHPESVERIPKEEPMQRSNVQSAKNNKQD